MPMRCGSSESSTTPIPSFLRASVSSWNGSMQSLEGETAQQQQLGRSSDLQDVLRLVPLVGPLFGQLQNLNSQNMSRERGRSLSNGRGRSYGHRTSRSWTGTKRTHSGFVLVQFLLHAESRG